MSTIGWMVGGSIACWAIAAALLDRQTGTEAFFGMIAPVASAAVTLAVVDRIYRRNPERLTSVMAAGFAAKMVFFGAYVVVMLRVLSFRPVPFIVSFTSYFVALHLIEGLALRRLFASGAGAR
jgi:hypothetical protein